MIAVQHRTDLSSPTSMHPAAAGPLLLLVGLCLLRALLRSASSFKSASVGVLPCACDNDTIPLFVAHPLVQKLSGA